MAGTGSCLCGDIKISYTGEPEGKALCYCRDCQKIGGAAFSVNYMIPDANFKLVSGTPTQYKKPTDTGHEFTSFLCSKCGSTLWREGVCSHNPKCPSCTDIMQTKYSGMKVLKIGVLDSHEVEHNIKFDAELFAPQRARWLVQQSGADQLSGTL